MYVFHRKLRNSVRSRIRSKENMQGLLVVFRGDVIVGEGRNSTGSDGRSTGVEG